MVKVALVSYDVQTVAGRAGGVGAFVTYFARLLRLEGEQVTIILTDGSTDAVAIDSAWRARYAAWGIELKQLNNLPPKPGAWAEAWPARLSARLADTLAEFDLVYVQDWANAGFHAIRQTRFCPAKTPRFVTVLHGPSAWIRAGNLGMPTVPDDLHLDFVERYSARFSDHVVAPSRYMLEWLADHGWRWRNEPQVLGLPFLPSRHFNAPATKPVFRRILLFGRLEVRKGFDLFAEALSLLIASQPEALSKIDEVVLLGSEPHHGTVESLRRKLHPLRIVHRSGLDAEGAAEYLAACVADTLVVIPSPFENFPYTVVEALSLPGLNVICSNGGGIPEVFGRACPLQLFAPSAPALAAKMAERLATPLAVEELAQYDHQAANARWLNLHRKALCLKREVPAQRPTSVDICVTFYNKGESLHDLLRALAVQTEQRFRVIVIDDGSTDPESIAAFDAASEAHSSRGWIFLRQANAFVDAARNRAAALSSAEYLLFIDADDVPTPNAVELLLKAAQASGADCLLSGGIAVAEHATPPYIPLGPDRVAGLVDPMVYGLPMILIRRAVFNAVGGYRERRGAGHEDWELQARLLQAGYDTDVLPEPLLLFRRAAEGLSSTGNKFLAEERLLETYAAPLRDAGLSGLPAVVFALNQSCLDLQERLKKIVPLDLRMALHRSSTQRKTLDGNP